LIHYLWDEMTLITTRGEQVRASSPTLQEEDQAWLRDLATLRVHLVLAIHRELAARLRVEANNLKLDPAAASSFPHLQALCQQSEAHTLSAIRKLGDFLVRRFVTQDVSLSRVLTLSYRAI
jgi:hypothetical protein